MSAADTLTVGDATLARIDEFVDTSFTATNFFRPFEPERLKPHMGWLAPRYYVPERDALVFSMHAWVVKTGRHTVLIDTCVGNDKERMPRAHWHHLKTPFLDRLRAAGAPPESIDYVMCTHMHGDHVGWNTMLKDGRWVPTFPNARYLFARVEYEYWAKNPEPTNQIRRNSFLDSVQPIVDAGRAVMIEDGHEVDGALTVELAPGHTPGNVFIRLASRGKEAVFAGDSVHHPMQAYEVGWSTSACTDPATAAVSRRRLLETCVSRGAMLVPAHFPAPFGAYVEAKGENFALRWRN